MDHLPSLRDAGHARAQVPYIRDGRFERRCFSSQNILEQLIEQEKCDSGLFQQCLFFGTMASVFAVYGIPLIESDFIVCDEGGRELVSSRLLPDYLAAWVVQASRQSVYALTRPERSLFNPADVGSKMLQVLTVNFFEGYYHDEPEKAPEACAMRILSTLDEAVTSISVLGTDGDAVDDAVWDSTLVLLDSLLNALWFIYRRLAFNWFDVRFSSVSALLHQELRSRGSARAFVENHWCPREVRVLRDLVEGDHAMLAVCAQLKRQEAAPSASHASCDSRLCRGYQIDESTYQTAHAYDDCRCGLVRLDSSYQIKMSQAVTEASSLPRAWRWIPMVSWEGDGLRVVKVSLAGAEGSRLAAKTSSLLDGSLSTRCVAISHVWADGMGNARENAMHECQVARLQVLANKLFPAKHWPIPFWIDTFCIPVAHEKARRLAIGQMEWVYKMATKILVLDRQLLSTVSRGMQEEEIGIRIMCSGWARRLWTLQEGAHQRRVHYQFADATHTYHELNAAVQARHAFPHRTCLLPDGHPLRAMLAEPPHCRTPTSTLRQLAYKPLNPCWPRIASFFKELDLDHRRWGSLTTDRLSSVIRTVQSRTTSRLEDEALVVSTLVHRHAGSAGSLVNVAASERYKEVFSGCDIPVNVIFLNGRRYEEDGYRWLSRSFLSQQEPLMQTLPLTAWNTGTLLQGEGLRIRLPAFSVAFPAAVERVPLHFRSAEYLFTVYEAGTGEFPEAAIAPAELAILMPKNALVTSHSAAVQNSAAAAAAASTGGVGRPSRYTGVLVRLLNLAEVRKRWLRPPNDSDMVESNWIRCRHEALVKAELLSDSDLQQAQRAGWRQGEVPLVATGPLDERVEAAQNLGFIIG